MDKNIQMHEWKNGFNRLFPITLDTNVFDKNGVSIGQSLVDFKADINNQLDGFQDGISTDLLTFMDEVDQKIAGIQINVKDYGVVGDGVTDDTLALKTVLQTAVDMDYIVYVPKGDYKINSSETWNMPKIIGDSATFNIDGELMFSTTGNVHIEGIEFITNGGLVNANTVNNTYSLIHHTDIQAVDTVVIKDVTVRAIVPTAHRLRTAIFIPKSNAIRVNNVNGYNIVNLIITARESKNIYISNIYGENIETLINMGDPYNAVVSNLFIRNTKTDSLWWMSKNTGRGYNGRDVILIEGGSNVYLDRIKGIWALERVIYCQASNVIASNIYSLNTGGVKFSGSKTDPNDRVDNIRVSNVSIVRTDPDVRDSVGQVYGVENIVTDGLTMESRITQSINFHSISGNNGTVIFNNVNLINWRNPVFKKLGGVTENLYVNNLYYKSVNTGDIDGILMVKDNNNTTSNDYINNITFKNVHLDYNDNLNVRNMIYNPEPNKIAKKINILNVNGLKTNSSSEHMYGMETLMGAEYENVTIRSLAGIGSLSSNMFNRNLITNKRLMNFKMINQEIDTYVSILINKPIERARNILDFVEKIVYNRKGSNDNQFSFPIRASYPSKFTIADKTGIATFLVAGNSITEIANTGTHIQVSTGGVADRITIYRDSSGYVSVRNRIPNNDYSVVVDNGMI